MRGTCKKLIFILRGFWPRIFNRLPIWCFFSKNIEFFNFAIVQIVFLIISLSGILVNLFVHSLHNFLLDKRIFIEFTNVFSRVELVVASLSKGNDQASSEAATWNHRQYAEVEQKSSSGIHLFGAENSSITKLISLTIFVWDRLLSNLSKNKWLRLLGLEGLIVLF